ncbi:MAG TPA: type II toxin-antitoxin system PrlF family antitoxin [Thermoflexales bacterium]|jgi:AbrB family looped-hinge helix DNA binding protein|nr:AbrB/MazE/SpoVT family DNA-binding domain-containing protein [Anaerolineae bacterium]HQV28052.1 type II toxin-antitoxin system PrlF family antitoxin [Thermoflexales bacterium]HQX11438.1 type II toxin-antitoxin system PrlF family antitoxin [Thermoflexales bacterium]HQY25883.1 type II toxin-antitoxin system PrlF family antitoxin [Thermoflexales bacterium]HQZ53480.1 type II toxin-antitoxin system PrlF family antitoxin [Thermoflexales bacterium]
MPEILMMVTSKGQVTIPAAVRRHLKIERSEKIALVLEADGTVRLKRPGFKKVADIRGAAGELGRNLTWNQMRTLAREDRGTAPRPAAG